MEAIDIRTIERKLQKHYQSKVPRKLFISVVFNCHQKIGSMLFSLNGSPPKGYALYIPDLWMLNFYDVTGQRWRIMSQVYLKISKKDIELYFDQLQAILGTESYRLNNIELESRN